MNKQTVIKYSLWIIFSSLIIGYKLTFHELWKDEWQAYLVARDMSLGEMFSFLNYEGHPALWYLYLKITSLFRNNFAPFEENLIQISHSLLVVGALFILFIKIKSPIWVKVGLAASYFLTFQYGIVNRGYVLVILFSLLAVFELNKGKTSTPFLVYIFLLCQTEVYGVFIAGVLVLYMLLQSFGDLVTRISTQRKSVISLLIGFMAFVITVYPRGHRDDFSRAYNQDIFNIDTILLAFQGNTSNAFLPGIISDTSQIGWSLLGIIFSMLTLVLLYLVFRKNKKILILMISMVLIMIVFGVVIYSGGIRQWGVTYICFMALVCLKNKESWDKLAIASFIVISLTQIVHMGRALERDIRLPFSITKQVGAFIKEKVPEEVPIVAINKFETSAVGAYADRPLFELPSGSQFTYFKWLEKVYLPTQSELNLFAKFKNVGGIVLVCPTPIDLERFPQAKLWQKFENPTYKLERMYLYSMPAK